MRKDMNADEIVNRIRNLMKSQNLNASKITKILEISSSSFTDWRSGKARPSLEVIAKFAEYFDVSIDYLVYGAENSKNENNYVHFPNSKEEKCLDKFRQLPPQLQEKLLSYADGMLATMPQQNNCHEKKFKETVS